MRVDHLHMVCRIAPAAKEYFDLRLNKEKKVCYGPGINELMKVNWDDDTTGLLAWEHWIPGENWVYQ